MSKIQAIPFIQAVLVTFTPEQQATLVSLINGSNKQPAFRSLINPNHMITTSDKGVNHVTLETKDRVFTGYLLYNNSYCVLLAYAKDTQNLVMVDIDLEAQDYRTVEESLTILELRFSLEDAKEPTDIVGTVQSAIDSGAIDVKAIENIEDTGVSDGSVVDMIGFDSEGNLVKGEVSEGQVVDQVLDSTSTNAVGNAPVATAIEGLQSDVSDIETALDTKADTADLLDGTLIPNKALQAKSIEAVSTESGAVQDTPFIYQGTGTANGTSIADTSPVGKHLEKQGNSVVWNQYDPDTAWSDSVGSNFTLRRDANTHKYTISGTPNTTGGKNLMGASIPAGHKVLLYFANYSKTGEANINLYLDSTYQRSFYLTDTNPTRIITTATSITSLIVGFTNGLVYGYEFNLYVIDLTQWFAGNIPQDLLDHPENFFRYYNGSLAYNDGTLENSDGRYLTCGGRNVWDEEWELGAYDWVNGTGEKVSNNNQIRSKNFIEAIPSTRYNFQGSEAYVMFYDANKNYIGYSYTSSISKFTTPSNCRYITFYCFASYGTTYKNDITISIYYETGDSYDQYYPYEEPKVYDTGSEVLRSAGSVRDVKLPDGTITRNVGSAKAKELGFVYDSSRPRFYVTGLGIKGSSSNLLLAGYTVSNAIFENPNVTDKVIGTDNNGVLFLVNLSCASVNELLATFTDNDYLNYEKTTPTTEQGTPFAENIEINDYGTMAWDSEVPQGCKIFYPADYALFIDSLGEKFNWDVDDIVSQSELTAVNNKIGAKIPECPTDTDGTYVLKAVVADGEVTYSWVAEGA